MEKCYSKQSQKALKLVWAEVQTSPHGYGANMVANVCCRL